MWRAFQAFDRRSVSRAKRMPAAKAKRRTFVPRIDYLEKRLTPVGNAFVESPVINDATDGSVDGIVSATLLATTGDTVVDPTGYTGFEANGGVVFGNAITYQVQGAPLGLFQGPTLMANPGDTLDITIVNNLKDFEGSAAFGDTNLHTHGLHVSALGNADNPFLDIEPGEENHYTIKIPANHPEGTFWYHPHYHGIVNSQIFGGLSGLLIIGRPDGGAPELNGLTQRLLGIKNFQTSATNIVDTGLVVASSQYAINGQLDPVISALAGETQVWNVANIGNGAFMTLAVRPQGGGQALPLFVVAEDGNPLTEPQQVPQVTLGGGRRTSFMIQIPAGTPAGTVFELALLPYNDGFNQWPLGVAGVSDVIGTVVVGNTPVTPFIIPTGPNSLSPPTNLFTDLTNEPVAEERMITFYRRPEDGTVVPMFTINGQTFPNVPLIQPRLNTVEEWTLINPDKDVHPFHIHTSGFQIMSVNGVPLGVSGPGAVLTANMTGGTGATTETFVGGGLTDVVNIPAAINGVFGKVVIRIKFGFVGPAVYHCHTASHEDMGMMGIFNVVPEDPTYAVGQNPGLVSTVRVFSGVTQQQISRFLPFGTGHTQGVTVAVGDVNGDGVYDFICGTGRTGNTRVRVVDGTKINDVNARGVIRATALLGDFFAFRRGQLGGVTVAAADINGDGKADVVVGAGRGNQSRVNVINATSLPRNATVPAAGAMLANFLAFDPLFRGGVTVAAGDVNGNGRIDLVVGSGPGQRAEVSIIKGTDLQNVSPNGRISAFALLGSLFPLGNTFTKGVNVATGNLKGFGFSDVIVSPSSGQAPRIEVYSPQYAMATHLDFEMIGTFYGYRPDDVTGVLVSSFWDPNHDVLLTLPARRNQNLRSTYKLCGELACTPSGGSGGHGH